MARLIDADKLKAHYSWWKGGSRELTMDEAKSDFDTIIDLQPTVEAEPKHGRWILNDLTGYTECSVCGEMTDISPVTGEECLTNYCPNCGARMDAQIGEDRSHPTAESVLMGMDEVEE